MTAFPLRPYQIEAVDAVIAARKRGVRRQVVCLPTGAGKTVIFSRLAALARRPVLVLAHRAELLHQAVDKLRRTLGGAEGGAEVVGLEAAAVRAGASARVVVASVRSLHEDRLSRLLAERRFGLVVYDECHHAPATDNQRVLRSLGCLEPDWDGTLLGFTATPQRADGLPLSDLFEEVVYSRGLVELVEDGYLVPLRGFRLDTGARLSGAVGERDDVEMDEQRVDIEERNALVARAVQELARDRRSLVFCVTVEHARHMALALRKLGVRADLVHGAMDPAERAEVLARFARGELQAVTNVGVLTEGFDDPGVSCVVMARPTRSQALYVQCVGRGTRPAPDKRDCLVLDFVDASSLPLVTLPVLWGLPRDLDLGGEDVREAAAFLRRLPFDLPGFAIEAGAITLQEIKDRAAAFDPLRAAVHPELRAISGNGWCSLGSLGLCLHLASGGKVIEVRIEATGRPGRRDRWQIRWDGKIMAHFSQIEAAVEAVDFEVDRRGPRWSAAAREDAPWRRAPVDAPRRAQLDQRGLRAADLGEALQLLSLHRAAPTPSPSAFTAARSVR
jgi:superfamily II DNA or RNA helicase